MPATVSASTGFWPTWNAHLLKRRYQPEMASPSWDATILEQSERIQTVLADSPSLRRELPGFFFHAYPRAVKKASAETQKPLSAFPSRPDEAFVQEWCEAIAPMDRLVLADARRVFLYGPREIHEGEE
jgi:hypothetical protein